MFVNTRVNTRRDPLTVARIFSVSILTFALTAGALGQEGAAAQAPCTTEDAYQTTGKWSRQDKDDLAMPDSTFPKEQYKPVLAKAQKVIELFKLASPEFKGIEAIAYRGIRGNPLFPNGPLPFRVDIRYRSYICREMNYTLPELRGKVLLFSNYGDTTVYFNSLGNVLAKSSMTLDGQEIFQITKQLGKFKGFSMIQPDTRNDQFEEALIIAPDNRLPYKPVTRKQYVEARIKHVEASLEKLKGLPPQVAAQTGKFYADEIAGLKAVIDGMSPPEQQMPAIVRNIGAGGLKIFATEAEGGRHLVTIDRSFFDPALPRDAIQFMTVYWSWSDKQPPKKEAILQFKNDFDFNALGQMLGK